MIVYIHVNSHVLLSLKSDACMICVDETNRLVSTVSKLVQWLTGIFSIKQQRGRVECLSDGGTRKERFRQLFLAFIH